MSIEWVKKRAQDGHNMAMTWTSLKLLLYVAFAHCMSLVLCHFGAYCAHFDANLGKGSRRAANGIASVHIQSAMWGQMQSSPWRLPTELFSFVLSSEHLFGFKAWSD